ncbi:unnamed protein product, partial [Musa acuminata subsp. burmannicoides]
ANSDGGARTTLVRRSTALRVRVVGILRVGSRYGLPLQMHSSSSQSRGAACRRI